MGYRLQVSSRRSASSRFHPTERLHLASFAARSCHLVILSPSHPFDPSLRPFGWLRGHLSAGRLRNQLKAGAYHRVTLSSCHQPPVLGLTRGERNLYNAGGVLVLDDDKT